MTKPPGVDQVRYLLLRRFPAADMLRLPPTLSHRGGQASAGGLQDRKKIREEVEAYERELNNMPPAALEALFDQERAIVWNEVVVRAEREEQNRFFNQPHAKADFAYWIKAAHWTLDEAIALSFGRAPEHVSWEKLKSLVQTSRFAFEYQRRRELALRACQWEQLFDPVLPGVFLAWARRTDVSIPPDLEAAVAAHGVQVADWKSLFDRLKASTDEQYAQLQSLCDRQALKIQHLLDQIKELETQFASAREQAPSLEKPLSTRERDSLLKLVIGMAMGGYGYVPTANRSEQPAVIEADLARQGVPLDVDTIRKWLKRGAELLPPEAEQE
jgi:hypothetical protein